MPYKDDMLGALRVVAALHPFQRLAEAHGYYIVLFEGTTATLSFDSKVVTEEEIRATIADARS